MKQYVIIARDGLDEAAPARRSKLRPLHLEGARRLKSSGNFVIGGAMLDETGTMRGSIMIVQFETENQFQEWYANEPYITGKVWEKIDIQPFRVAEV
jgi:uncharacterized protein